MTKLLNELYEQYQKDKITWDEYVKEKKETIKDCEVDCKIVCTGCDRFFHDIKEELNLPHDEELPETFCTNGGDDYCHIDCFNDGR